MAAKKILIIDDQGIRTCVKRILVSAGYDVTVARDLTDGVELLRELLPDLLVIEPAANNGELDGWGVIKQVREDPALAKIAIFALSRLHKDADLYKMWQIGVDCLSTKPPNPEELLKYIRQILDG